jgi:hypothetical protein
MPPASAQPVGILRFKAITTFLSARFSGRTHARGTNMRLFFKNQTHAAGVAKSLLKHVAFPGSGLTLSRCQEIVARMYGYADWHDLVANCSSQQPSPWDDKSTGDEIARRHSQYRDVLLSSGVHFPQVVIDAIRPTALRSPERRLLPLILSNKCNLMYDNPVDPDEFKSSRETALKRDKMTCRHCGFDLTKSSSSKYVQVNHLDADHYNLALENTVATCAHCHAVQHISLWGCYGSTIVYLPELSQALAIPSFFR